MPPLPKTIKEHKYGKLWSSIWNEVHNKDSIASITFCGKRGKGKSMSMLAMADLLDRTHNDVPRFNMDRFCLDPKEFFMWLNAPRKTMPRGTVICLDDAGLHLYKADFLVNMVKRINKTLQNIRYKNPIVMLSLPYFEMLVKDAREMSDVYIELTDRDKKAKENLGKVQKLSIAPFSGDLYRYTIVQEFKHTNRELNMPLTHYIPKEFRFGLPRKELIDAYKQKRNEFMDKFNVETIQVIEAEEKKPNGVRMDKNEMINYLWDNREKFKEEEKYNAAKVALDPKFSGGLMTAQRYIKILIEKEKQVS